MQAMYLSRLLSSLRYFEASFRSLYDRREDVVFVLQIFA